MAAEQARKYCWQVDYLSEPTSCFKKAGGLPCEEAGCPVTDKVEELEAEGIPVGLDWIQNLLVHSRCRISSLSSNNQEYLERVRNTPPGPTANPKVTIPPETGVTHSEMRITHFVVK